MSGAPMARTVVRPRDTESGARPTRGPLGEVAVMVSRFPKLTETFVLRELDELERQGLGVTLVPLIRHREETVHAAARPWIDRALWTPWIDRRVLAGAVARLRRRPGAVISGSAHMLWGALTAPGLLVRTLALLPRALYLAEILERRGVTHVHAHFATHPTTVAWLIARVSDLEFSFSAHAHDIFVDTRLLAHKVRDARFVRAISAYNARLLRELVPGAPVERIRVMRLGVDRARLRDDAAAPAARREGTLRLLAVAALRPYKGLDVLIDACAHLRDHGVDLHCEIVGEGPERAALTARIGERHLEDRVTLRGALTEERVRARLRAADLFVHPGVVARNGQKDGIPVALMEAMAVGLPVVATRLSGIPELVRDGDSGLLVEPGEPAALADTIARLAADRDLWARLATGAEETIREDFDLERNTALLTAALAELVAPPSSDRLRALLDGSDLAPVEALATSTTRHGPDATVTDLTVFVAGAPQLLVLKEHADRPGADRSAAVRARHEHLLLERLSTVLAKHPDLRVPEPLAVDGAAVLMRRSPGERLDRIVGAGRRPGAPSAWRHARAGTEAAGRWLGTIHRELREPAGPGGGAVEWLARRAGEALARIPTADRARAQRLVERLAGRAREGRAAGDEATTLCHGDYWPGNVLVDGRIVSVVDLEGAGRGAAAYDVAYFLLHLEAWYRRPFLASRRRELTTRFLAGYGDPPPGLPILRLARASVALELLARAHRRPPRERRRLRRAFLRAGEWKP